MWLWRRRVAGHLNDVTHTPLARSHSERLREIISKCERFIQLCGPTLSLGLSVHVDEVILCDMFLASYHRSISTIALAVCLSQAQVLLELRESAAQKNWAAVSAALGSPALRRDMTRISRIVKQETDFLARARDFHLLDRQLQDFVSSFDPAPPVRNMSFQYLQIDLQRAKEIFHALQSFDSPPSQPQPQPQQPQWHLLSGLGKVIGDEYFSQDHFQSFQLLLR